MGYRNTRNLRDAAALTDNDLLQINQPGGNDRPQGSLRKVSLATLAAYVQGETVVGNIGTPGTGVTAIEEGNATLHQTTLTLAAVLPAIAGGANLAVGTLLYTFPAGDVIIDSTYMSVAITQTEANITADTPDVGIGTVIASGVVAVLGGTATFEDIINGTAAADCNGTATVQNVTPTAGAPLLVPVAGGDVYFNAADGWAASGDAAATLTGTVVLNWRYIS